MRMGEALEELISNARDPAQAKAAEREKRFHALLADHRGFMRDRLALC